MPEIILNNVTKRFGKFVAVDKLNLVIDNNAFITLLGPSGCGKTTTLRMIAGLEDPSEGSISIDGKIVFDADRGINLSPDKRDVGFLFQNYALWPHMTVYQNIAFGLENLKWDKQKIRDRVNELLTMLKIEQFELRYPSELSGGQQQRVAIARTLAPKPQVLFMDEPLSNLDAKLRMEMRAELKRLHIDTKATFVYVTHDQLEAMTLSTKVCIMEKGALKQYAPPLQMYARPSNLFVADFMGNPPMNFLHGTARIDKPNSILIHAGEWEYTFVPSEQISLQAEKVVLGIRPEYISINEEGSLPAQVYSTLPAGMETTVRLSLGRLWITAVVFGSVDYPFDSRVQLGFKGDNMMLFDEQSGESIASGTIAAHREKK